MLWPKAIFYWLNNEYSSQNISKSYKNNPLRLFLLMSKKEKSLDWLVLMVQEKQRFPDIDYTLLPMKERLP
jgi:hypothetical protein